MNDVPMDLFAPILEIPQDETIERDGRSYRLFPVMTHGHDGIGIAWTEPGRSGVLGGVYADRDDCVRAIDFNEYKRAHPDLERAMWMDVA